MFHEPVYRLFSGRGIKISRALRARNGTLPWPPHLQNASAAYAYSPWIYCYQRKFVLQILAIKSYIGIIIILAMPI